MLCLVLSVVPIALVPLGAGPATTPWVLAGTRRFADLRRVPAAEWGGVRLPRAHRPAPGRGPAPGPARPPCRARPRPRGSRHRYGRTAPAAQRERNPSCEGAAMTTDDWEDRTAAAWAGFDDDPEQDPAAFRAVIDALAAELPGDGPRAPFERACAWDSTGHPDRAVPLYREALARGLGEADPYRGRRARIQLASSLRNLGRPQEGVDLLTPELDAPSDELDDAVRATLALCLSSLGRDREGLSLVLEALAAHLPRYRRSMAAYARRLTDAGP
ncbi:hypothetical protein GCM10010259_30390 [Streptomyces daghestanicus]|nr:hypothetical protein GCM10010259_30390 [Streptomyces daghestanicus]GHI34607.1 hypothetical protein Sdagh_63370 [Streptomyces daghestanicus]